MRLRRITISGFRAWARSETFDLDADAVIVIGPNSKGKTSLFDAILWSLTGSIPRLRSDASVVSMYNDSGQASVTIELGNGTSALSISRLFDGEEQRVRVSSGDRSYDGLAAESHLLERLWPVALTAPSPRDAMVAAFTNCIYLQQDLVRDFIEDADGKARYSAVSEIIGTGRITELQLQLDRAKTQSTKATNSRYEESADVRRRLRGVEGPLKSIRTARVDAKELGETWNRWWSDSQKVIDLKPDIEPSSTRAASTLDRALKELQARHLAIGREESQLVELQQLLATSPAGQIDGTSEADVRAELSVIERRIAELRIALDTSHATERSRQEAERAMAEARSEVAALASLALKHLDRRCPVCDQEYDKTSTRKRLQAAIKKAGLPIDRELGASLKLKQLSSELRDWRTEELRWRQSYAHRPNEPNEYGLGKAKCLNVCRGLSWHLRITPPRMLAPCYPLVAKRAAWSTIFLIEAKNWPCGYRSHRSRNAAMS